LQHFSTGKHSFAHHYPHFYKDICELERFNLFYSLNDFRSYIKEINLPLEQGTSYLQGIVEIIHNRVKKINRLVNQDLQQKFNHHTQKVLSHGDLAVLMAYLEKLQATEQCLTKLTQLLA